MPVARWVEDDPGVASAAPTSRSLNASASSTIQRIGRSGEAERSALWRPRHRRAEASTCVTAAPAATARASRVRCTRRGGARPDRRSRHGPRPARPEPRAHATCSGNSPTWPASVARSRASRRRRRSTTDHRRLPARSIHRRGRTEGRPRARVGFGPRTECPGDGRSTRRAPDRSSRAAPPRSISRC